VSHAAATRHLPQGGEAADTPHTRLGAGGPPVPVQPVLPAGPDRSDARQEGDTDGVQDQALKLGGPTHYRTCPDFTTLFFVP
jgi:hypothetical protein